MASYDEVAAQLTANGIPGTPENVAAALSQGSAPQADPSGATPGSDAALNNAQLPTVAAPMPAGYNPTEGLPTPAQTGADFQAAPSVAVPAHAPLTAAPLTLDNAPPDKNSDVHKIIDFATKNNLTVDDLIKSGFWRPD